MPRSLYHWTYDDVTDFPTAKGFAISYDEDGLGEAWMAFEESGDLNDPGRLRRSVVVAIHASRGPGR
jgi:hypothetical protein